MLATSSRCPSCGHDVHPDDARCGACRQVLGPDNVCEHCHALAPVTPQGDRLVCSACERERTRRPKTFVVTPRRARRLARRQHKRLFFYRALSVLLALAALFVPTLGLLGGQNDFEKGVALLLGVVAILLSVLSARRRRLTLARSAARERFALEQRIVGLAHRSGGVVTGEQVALHLHLPQPEADRLLDALVHSGRAEMDMTERGELRFVVQGAGAAAQALPSGTPSTTGAARARRQGESL